MLVPEFLTAKPTLVSRGVKSVGRTLSTALASRGLTAARQRSPLPTTPTHGQLVTSVNLGCITVLLALQAACLLSTPAAALQAQPRRLRLLLRPTPAHTSTASLLPLQKMYLRILGLRPQPLHQPEWMKKSRSSTKFRLRMA